MDTRDIVDIFNRFDISSIKDESKYKISTLGSITNLNYKVEIGDKKFVLRVPGENPDLINRISEGYNEKLIQSIGISLPLIVFEEETGLKISEYFEDLYTFKSTDMLDIKFRDDALNLLTILHNSELKLIVKLSPSCPSSWTKKIPPSIEYSTVTYTVPPELLLKDRVEVL